ncbi:protein SLOW GREEN 1, chloroplastic [Diospyros lotus]|uniref:protein SLOW GREEN 1, chloroplastic n=1 Tax=Diospyros lotus TaxID=55363 RepID=UPI00224E8AD0|nr:protein SLOW GREEN 1, chloroplastic [Diospyros lotus]
MDSALAIGLGSSSVFHLKTPPFSIAGAAFKPSLKPPSYFSISRNPSFNPPFGSSIKVKAFSGYMPGNGGSSEKAQNPFIQKLKTAAAATAFVLAASAAAGKFGTLPARAEAATAVTEETVTVEEEEKLRDSSSSPLSQFLELNSEAVEALKSLLQQKLEAGEDEEALEVLKKLVAAQPEETDWKFLMARLLNEMGKPKEAKEVFEEILKLNPLSFEALFENALLMDRCGEENAVITRLEEALRIAEDDKKAKEARDVRLIMAQIQFLQKNVDEALRSYEELAREDPNDFRPYFCKGMIYSLLDRNKEAKEEFAKYRELSPKKFEVEGYLRTPLSRMKLFGTNEDN